MENLKIRQREWLNYRDDIAKGESLEFKGGTMEGLQYTETLARVTKERCCELVNHILNN